MNMNATDSNCPWYNCHSKLTQNQCNKDYAVRWPLSVMLKVSHQYQICVHKYMYIYICLMLVDVCLIDVSDETLGKYVLYRYNLNFFQWKSEEKTRKVKPSLLILKKFSKTLIIILIRCFISSRIIRTDFQFSVSSLSIQILSQMQHNLP